MPLSIPLARIPSQTLRTTLAGQRCRLRIYSRDVQLPDWRPQTIATDPPVSEQTLVTFLDLYVNDALVLGGVRCYNDNRLVRDSYLGFVGDLAFTDVYGDQD